MSPTETIVTHESTLKTAEQINEAEQLIEINQISSDIFNRVPLKAQPEMRAKLAPAEREWIDDLQQINQLRREARKARVAARRIAGQTTAGAGDEGVAAAPDVSHEMVSNPADANAEQPIAALRERAVQFFSENYFYFFEEVEQYLEKPLTDSQRQELAEMMVDIISRLVQVRTNVNQLRERLGRVLGAVFQRDGERTPRRTTRQAFFAAMNGRADTEQTVTSFMAGRVINRIVEMKKQPAAQTQSASRYGETVPTYSVDDEQPAVVADELLYAARPTSEKTEIGNPILNQLEAEKKQAQLQESVAFLSPINRRQYLKSWLSERFRERPKIAGTAFDRRILREISRSREIMNGLAGVILFGPPGTGKTQFLIEANQQDGFETRVVSIHKYTDMVQLLGEPEIQVSLNQGNFGVRGLVELTNNPAEFQAWFANAKETRPAIYHQLVDFVRRYAPNPQAELRDETVAAQFIQTVKDIQFREAMAATEGITKEQAWLKGEILRAIQNKERVVLDEIEKTQLGGLDSISNFLALKPGDTIKLGSESIQIPYWFRVDATANALTLPEHLKNRFSSTLKIDYPPAGDMLQKVALWTANDNGDIRLPAEDQAKLVGVFTYLVPRIQELYAQLLEERARAEEDSKITVLPSVLSPLSLRNLAVFCQDVANRRKTVDEAIDTYFLAPGQLSQSGDQDPVWQRLAAIINEYQTLFVLDREYVPRNRDAEPLIDAVADSALFADLPTIRVDAAQRKSIPELQTLPSPKKEIDDNRVLLSNGWELAVDAAGVTLVGGGVTVWRSSLAEAGVNSTNVRLLDCSEDGKAIIIQVDGRQTYLVTPFATETTQELSQGRDWTASPDGRVIAGVVDKNIKLIYTDGKGETIVILPGNNYPTELQFSLDGTHLLVNASPNYFDVPVPQEMTSTSKRLGYQANLPRARWQYVRNLLVEN